MKRVIDLLLCIIDIKLENVENLIRCGSDAAGHGLRGCVISTKNVFSQSKLLKSLAIRTNYFLAKVSRRLRVPRD